jgi:glycosyltransferase involved in cell wall biosynthesis
LNPSPQPRILYVHNSADIYGASRSLLRLLPRIRDRGYLPEVLLPEEGPLWDRIAELQVPVTLDRSLSVITRSVFGSARLAGFLLSFPGSVRRVRRLIRERNIDLVHTNTGVILSPALAARVARVPHIWHVRDSFLEFRGLWGLYRRYITGLSNRVIAVSNPIAGQFAGAANVQVIHNGVALEEFALKEAGAGGAFRERFQLGAGPVVGCVGRIKFVRKGQEVLVEAAARLKERGVRAKFVVVGSPSPGSEDHLTRLKQLIQDRGLAGDVVLTGELADPKPAYAAMDVFVLPSAQPEPFGGVVLEAMGMARPVIATAMGGSLDQVEEGRTGFLVPPGNAEALADKLALLLADRSLRERMGIAGRERLAGCFSIQQMVDKIELVYQCALKTQKG